jgi:uncharacterized protein YydD (DUF2326 family)
MNKKEKEKMKITTKYDQYIERKRREYGEKFNPSDLAKQFIPYFNDGKRIKVETCGMTITGTVGVTTGWKPAFLLMRTSRSIGSPCVLSENDKITAVKYGKKYQERMAQ